jgi:peptidase E
LALLGQMTALNGIMLIGWSTGANLRHPAARSV